jgi:hypothetical protein
MKVTLAQVVNHQNDVIIVGSTVPKSVLCIPVVTPDGDCFAVIELVRSIYKNAFHTRRPENLRDGNLVDGSRHPPKPRTTGSEEATRTERLPPRFDQVLLRRPRPHGEVDERSGCTYQHK